MMNINTISIFTEGTFISITLQRQSTLPFPICMVRCGFSTSPEPTFFTNITGFKNKLSTLFTAAYLFRTCSYLKHFATNLTLARYNMGISPSCFKITFGRTVLLFLLRISPKYFITQWTMFPFSVTMGSIRIVGLAPLIPNYTVLIVTFTTTINMIAVCLKLFFASLAYKNIFLAHRYIISYSWIKQEYFQVAVNNLKNAETLVNGKDMFSASGMSL
jgi:hypothetical protein